MLRFVDLCKESSLHAHRGGHGLVLRAAAELVLNFITFSGKDSGWTQWERRSKQRRHIYSCVCMLVPAQYRAVRNQESVEVKFHLY